MKTVNPHGNHICILKIHIRVASKLTYAVICLICIGCAATTGYNLNPAAPRLPQNARVLLMPPDIQVFELTAGGLKELKVEWTIAAQKHVHKALNDLIQAKQDTLIEYEPFQGNSNKVRAFVQLIKLHEAVGLEIIVHKYIPRYGLPTKKDKFDWSLGSAVRPLTQRYDADCALFVYIRDSYASADRKAAMVLAAVAGVGIGGGRQVGFSSLVDLRTGEIIWFSRISSETGDIRTPKAARKAVRHLLDGIPL